MPRKPPNSTEPGLTAGRSEVKALQALIGKPVLSLKDYYNAGELVRRLSKDRGVAHRGSNWRQQLAELVGCSASTLTKTMQFCNAYEAEGLGELEALGVGWSRLTIALAVDDAKDRHRLLRQAKKDNWNERELQRAIQQKRGSRRRGGRHRRRMRGQGLLADRAELMRLTKLWTDFHEQVWSKGADGYLNEAERLDDDGRANLTGLLDEAISAFRELAVRGGTAETVVKQLCAKLFATKD
jgi:hypothetical protein